MNSKQRTFYVHAKKITIISRFNFTRRGFGVKINDEKFFNTGDEKEIDRSDFKSDDKFFEHRRDIAEDRCYVKWLNKHFIKRENINSTPSVKGNYENIIKRRKN